MSTVPQTIHTIHADYCMCPLHTSAHAPAPHDQGTYSTVLSRTPERQARR